MCQQQADEPNCASELKAEVQGGPPDLTAQLTTYMGRGEITTLNPNLSFKLVPP